VLWTREANPVTNGLITPAHIAPIGWCRVPDTTRHRYNSIGMTGNGRTPTIITAIRDYAPGFYRPR
jgi:hypothetical protein